MERYIIVFFKPGEKLPIKAVGTYADTEFANKNADMLVMTQEAFTNLIYLVVPYFSM